MIRQGHVGNYGFPLMIAIATSVHVFFSMPQSMAKIGQSAGWMIPLLGALTVLPIYFLYYKLLRRFPGKGIAFVNEEVWGPYIGIPLFVFLWTFTMLVTALTLRQFVETFITVALPRTPISVLLMVAIAIFSYASLLGIEPITRAAWIVGPWILLAVMVILVGVLPNAQVRYLQPVWGPGIPRLLLNGAKSSAWYFELMIAGIFFPSFRHPNDFLRSGVIGTCSAALIISIATAVTTVTASASETLAIPYPLYFLARQIYFGRFIQRVEALFILVWFFAMVIGLSFVYHGGIIGLAEGLHLPFYQPLVYPSAVILFALALWPRSFVDAQSLDAFGFRQYGWLIYVLAVVTYLVALVRRKGKPSKQGKRQSARREARDQSS